MTWKPSPRSLLSLLLVTSGCSLVFSSPPPAGAERGHARPQLDCSTSNAAPIIDSVLTTYELVRVGTAIVASDRAYRSSPISREADLALGAGFAAVFLGSAIYGYHSAARCRRAKAGQPLPPTDVPGVTSESYAP